MYKLKTELPIELQNTDDVFPSTPQNSDVPISEDKIVWKIIKTASGQRCMEFLRGLPASAITQAVKDAIDERFPPEHEQRNEVLAAIHKRKGYVKKGRKRKRPAEE